MALSIGSGLCNRKGTKRRAVPQGIQHTPELSSQTAAMVTFMERYKVHKGCHQEKRLINFVKPPLGKRLADLLRAYQAEKNNNMSEGIFDPSDDKVPRETRLMLHLPQQIKLAFGELR